MRTQPQTVIERLESDNSRLVKEAILAETMEENLDEFFQGLKMALDRLYTFGVKQVPVKEQDTGQGLSWNNFLELATALYRRELTGHAARDGIQEGPRRPGPDQCAVGAGFPRLAGDNQPGGGRVQHGIQAPL